MYPFLTTRSAAILACAPVSFLPVSTYNANCFPLLHTVLLSLHPLILRVDVSQHLSSCPFASLIVWLCSGPHSFQVVELLEDFKKNIQKVGLDLQKFGLRRWGYQDSGWWSVCPVSKPPPHFHLQGWTTPPCFPFHDGLFWNYEQE